jgi:hypothetical protein
MFPRLDDVQDAKMAHESLSEQEAAYLANQWHRYLRFAERANMVRIARMDGSRSIHEQDTSWYLFNRLCGRYYDIAWQYYAKLTTGAWKVE